MYQVKHRLKVNLFLACGTFVFELSLTTALKADPLETFFTGMLFTNVMFTDQGNCTFTFDFYSAALCYMCWTRKGKTGIV